MSSREFVYWLQGFFELTGTESSPLDTSQVDLIRRHLKMVFHHEIDPSYPDTVKLSQIHDPKQDTIMRC
jgi:hypothetical protein